MQPDTYTKVVITAIAICLLWLCFANAALIPRAGAQASQPPQEVVVVGLKAPEGGNYWGTWSPIFVRIVPPEPGQKPRKK